MRYDGSEDLVFEFKIPSWQDFSILNDLVTPGLSPQAQTYSHLIAKNALCFALINEQGYYAHGPIPPTPGSNDIVNINLTATAGAGLPTGILIPYLNTVCAITGTVRIYVEASQFYTEPGSNGLWTMVLYRNTSVPLSASAPMVDPQVVSHFWGGTYSTLCSEVTSGLPPLSDVPTDLTAIRAQTDVGGTLWSNAASASAAAALVTPIGEIHTQTTSGGALFNNAASAANNTQNLGGLNNQLQLMTQILAYPRNFYPAPNTLSTLYPPSLYPNLTFDFAKSYLLLEDMVTYLPSTVPAPLLFWTCWKDQDAVTPALTLGDIVHTLIAGIVQQQFYAPNTIPNTTPNWTVAPYSLVSANSYLVIAGGSNPDYAWSCWKDSVLTIPAATQNEIQYIRLDFQIP